MAWLVCIAVLAAFGALSVLWALFGWMIPGCREGILIWQGGPGLADSPFVKRYLFLRDMGLAGFPLLIVDQGISETERRCLERKNNGIELCSWEELLARLELERSRSDRTGNGNHSGRDQRRGISEL